MRNGFSSRFATVVSVIGVLIFVAALVIDLVGDGSPAVIVFDAAMLLFFAGSAASELKVLNGAWQFLAKEGTTFISGAVLAGSFIFFAMSARSATTVLLSLAAIILGLFMAMVSGRRLFDAFSSAPDETERSGERR